MKFKNGPVKIIAVVIAAILLGVCVYFGFPRLLRAFGFLVSLFLPFILGYVFSMLVNPLADKLQRRLKLPRGVSAVLVLVLTLGIIGGIVTGIIWKIIDEIRNLYIQFPAIYESWKISFESLSVKWSDIYVSLPENLQNIINNLVRAVQDKASGLVNRYSSTMMTHAGNFAKMLQNIVISFIVFILSSFFMVSDARKVRNAVSKVIGKNIVERLHEIKVQLQKYLGGYVKAQCIIMLIATVIIFIGLTILGVEYALLIAVVTALIDALPFFGSGAVLLPWSLISFINSDIKTGIGLLIIYLVIMFTRQMIEPKIVSKNIGMNPILTLMAMYVGYRTFSLGGMIVGPLLLMTVISLYNAHVFDGAIKILKDIKVMMIKEYRALRYRLDSAGREEDEDDK